MTTSTYRYVPAAANIVHRIACVLGMLAVMTFALFALGLGLPPWAELNASFAALGVMIAGFLVMWWKDWLGGLVSLAGLGWFQALEIAANGHPAGGLFPLLILPGALGLLATVARYFSHRKTPLASQD
jgi:hypothetical protein